MDFLQWGILKKSRIFGLLGSVLFIPDILLNVHADRNFFGNYWGQPRFLTPLVDCE
jgi:hypothetical protein